MASRSCSFRPSPSAAICPPAGPTSRSTARRTRPTSSRSASTSSASQKRATTIFLESSEAGSVPTPAPRGPGTRSRSRSVAPTGTCARSARGPANFSCGVHIRGKRSRPCSGSSSRPQSGTSASSSGRATSACWSRWTRPATARTSSTRITSAVRPSSSGKARTARASRARTARTSRTTPRAASPSTCSCGPRRSAPAGAPGRSCTAVTLSSWRGAERSRSPSNGSCRRQCRCGCMVTWVFHTSPGRGDFCLAQRERSGLRAEGQF